ncbi:Lrp/AsnC family transcriptional regulator [Branchiibius cervicis]|uniref:Lrp/AsnC family transcriptional regulator n=1 Tax=Branchiibius cervicis TaxID=908252 RepID=A0ABW2AU52_9MICO
MQAYILIQTDVGKATSVTSALRELPGVLSAEEVIGPYDLIAKVEAPSVENLGAGVITQIQQVPGITRTLTCSVVR